MGFGIGARAAPCTRALPVDTTDRNSHLSSPFLDARQRCVLGFILLACSFRRFARIHSVGYKLNMFWRVGGMGAADQNKTRGARSHSHIIHMLHSMDIPEGQVGVGEIQIGLCDVAATGNCIGQESFV
jgi:hypothetical protein